MTRKAVNAILTPMNALIAIRVVKGDPIEFGVITASFYGLRRSEVLGLKWDAIDFENKTITIRHTVHEVTIDGKTRIVASDTTKTKSSYRSLPLVKPFEEILLSVLLRATPLNLVSLLHLFTAFAAARCSDCSGMPLILKTRQ